MNKQIFVSIAESLQWVDDIVVFVWAILSILMIGTAWLLYKNSSGISKEVTLVIILIVATWTYPLYTLNYQLVSGLAGNILYLVVTIFVIYQVRNVSVNIAYMLYPIVAWVSFATIYVIFQLLAR